MRDSNNIWGIYQQAKAAIRAGKGLGVIGDWLTADELRHLFQNHEAPPVEEEKEWLGMTDAQRRALAATLHYYDCETCHDTGVIDATLGGEPTSNPHMPCPACEPVRITPLTNTIPRAPDVPAGNGWWPAMHGDWQEVPLCLPDPPGTSCENPPPQQCHGSGQVGGLGAPQGTWHCYASQEATRAQIREEQRAEKTYATREERDAAEAARKPPVINDALSHITVTYPSPEECSASLHVEPQDPEKVAAVERHRAMLKLLGD